jgi:hypothetical protein
MDLLPTETDRSQFRFFDLEEALFMLGPSGRSRVSQGDVEGQKDPFYAECRAYSRIASKPRKRPISIACHGFISISAEQESFFAKNFNVKDWDRPEEEYLSSGKRQPFRALVKDLVEVDPMITPKLITSMRRELKSLNSLRIYVMDVRWSNYKGGHLVDFSSAWTVPHLEFRKDVNTEHDIKLHKEIDMAAFEVMVEEELGMDLPMKSEPNPDFIGRLRPRRKKA